MANEPLALPWSLPYSQNQETVAAALQDLRNIRPLLISAAEYYEMAYLHSNRKETYAVKQNLQDYCTKVLVNSVDHLGTIASHLEECLSLVAVQMSKLDASVANVAGRFSACRERTALSRLSQVRQVRPMKPIYLKYYDSEGKHFTGLPYLSPRKVDEVFQASAGSDSGAIRSLSWYLTFESASYLESKQDVKRHPCLKPKDGTVSDEGHSAHSLSISQNPTCAQIFDRFAKELLYDSSNSLGLLLMRDSMESEEETVL